MTKIAALEKHPRRPRLGQHFLVDSSATMRIVVALGDISEGTVLEIGPGRGALTSALAKRARRLIAIEIDRVLAAQLRMNFSQEPNVEIIEGDVLAIDVGRRKYQPLNPCELAPIPVRCPPSARIQIVKHLELLATDGAPNCNPDLDARRCTCTSASAASSTVPVASRRRISSSST